MWQPMPQIITGIHRKAPNLEQSPNPTSLKQNSKGNLDPLASTMEAYLSLLRKVADRNFGTEIPDPMITWTLRNLLF